MTQMRYFSFKELVCKVLILSLHHHGDIIYIFVTFILLPLLFSHVYIFNVSIKFIKNSNYFSSDLINILSKK